MHQSRTTLLRLAIPSVTSTGFTRQTLANSVLSLSKPHSEPLSESTVSSLFGEGDEARRTLINAWFEDARSRMRESPDRGLKGLLKFRLEHNEPVMHLLPEVFCLRNYLFQ